MATDLQNLQTRRSAVLAELAALSPTRTYSIDGQSVDHDRYRASLLDEAAQLNALIAALAGPIELKSRGVT